MNVLRLRILAVAWVAICVPRWSTALRANSPALPSLVVAEVTSPAGPGSRDPILATGPDESVWMVWEEPSSPASTDWNLRCCRFDSRSLEWSPVGSVAMRRRLHSGANDVPTMTASGNGRLYVAWSEPATGTLGRRIASCDSIDGGFHWTAPEASSTESTACAYPTLTTLADGRVLLAWLDRRGRSRDESASSIYLRFLTGPMTVAPDWLFDAHASPDAQPALAPFIDGGAGLAYRGLSDDGSADPRFARLHGRKWENRRAINSEGPNGKGFTPGGPSLVADGGRLAVAWRAPSAGGGDILFSTSPDAGARFLAPARINAATPVGRPSVALLHDGAGLVAWSEQTGLAAPVAWMRRCAPEFSLNPAVPLGPVSDSGSGDCVQITIVRNFSGDALSAKALVAFQAPGTPGGIRTMIVNIPEADLLSVANDDCHCAPTPMQLVGYSIFGTVVSIARDRHSVVIESDSVPGVLDAGRTSFLINPSLAATLNPGRECLGRITRKDGKWTLFDARMLEEAR